MNHYKMFPRQSSISHSIVTKCLLAEVWKHSHRSSPAPMSPDYLTRPLREICCKIPCGNKKSNKISRQNLYERSLFKSIHMRSLQNGCLARPLLCKMAEQDLYERLLQNIPFLYKISSILHVSGLVGRTSIKDLPARSLGKSSPQDLWQELYQGSLSGTSITLDLFMSLDKLAPPTRNFST